MRTKKVLIIMTIAGNFLLTSCGGGSSFGDNGSNGGGAGSLNIQSLSSISLVAGTAYSPYCIYHYGNYTTLVKSDGSGTGVGLDTNTGQVSQLFGLPIVNSANGDSCLINFGQLSWHRDGTSIVNIFDPETKTTQTVDLSHTGLSGSVISKTSFGLDVRNNQLYANSTFLDDGYVGFSKFSLTSPINTYTQFDNSSYHFTSNSVLYGFMGLGSSFIQMYQTDTVNNLPATLVGVVMSGSNIQQNVLTITDSKNNPIEAMSSATDVIYNGTSVVVNTGTVQPVLYNCKRSTTIDWNYSCNKTYTDSLLTNKYRIVRLLGANENNLYFLGIDLTHATLNIFSMAL